PVPITAAQRSGANNSVIGAFFRRSLCHRTRRHRKMNNYWELLTTRFSGKGRRQKSIEACPWQQQRYVAPHYEATLPLPRHLITLFSSSGRTCGVRVAHKERKARDVIGDVLKADFGLGPHLADGADIAAVHGRLDMAENVLDTYAHPRTLGVGGFLLRGQRFVAI